MDTSTATLSTPFATVDGLPIVDVSAWLNRATAPTAAAEEAKRVAAALHEWGVVIVRDARATEQDNDNFLDLMERYYAQTEEARAADVRKELHYQVGTTPGFVEKPRNHCDVTRALAPANRPLSLCPPERDAKGRFFWRLGAPPLTTRFPQMNAPAVVPAAFSETWAGVMNAWGGKLLAAGEAVAAMAAAGLGLADDDFTSRMVGAPHLLAPTAVDLKLHGAKGTVLAGFHADLNFITVHGRSRFPGLYVWTRDGRRRAVRGVPAGCLLVQAGRQLEYATAGYVLAGFHEVVVDDSTVATVAAAAARGDSCWRISSTAFLHLASDVELRPYKHFAEVPEAAARFPSIFVGDHVAAELRAISLAPSDAERASGDDDAVAAM